MVGTHQPRIRDLLFDVDGNHARLQAHPNNVDRYRRLLATRLTDLERSYIEGRLREEQLAMEALSAGTLPLMPPAARLAAQTAP